MHANRKLLGGLSFVSRTFEGRFKENPYVLDTDANLYIGPADHLSRDEHSGIEVIYHFLAQTGRISLTLKELLRNRISLLEAFNALDESRMEGDSEEFHVFIFGTYDGEMLLPVHDDDLPAGPCGKSVNDLKIRFYKLCRKVDKEFDGRELDSHHISVERRLLKASV